MITPLDKYPFLTPFEAETVREWRKSPAGETIVRVLNTVSRFQGRSTDSEARQLGQMEGKNDLFLSIALIGTPAFESPKPPPPVNFGKTR